MGMEGRRGRPGQRGVSRRRGRCGMNGERPPGQPRAAARSLSPLKVTRRRVGPGRSHRSALFPASPRNRRSNYLFFPQGGLKKYQQVSLSQN